MSLYNNVTPGSEAEKRLQDAAMRGTVAQTKGLKAAEKTVRPAYLRWLLLQPGIDPAGVRIKGAAFKEPLDLANLSLAFPLCLTNCRFQKPVVLTDAEFRSLCFDDSTFGGCFSAKGLTLKRDFSAERATFQDYLDLRQARIGGSAMLAGAKLNARSEVDRLSGIAFLAYAMHVEDNLMMCSDAKHRFEAKGAVRLLGAKIGGQWTCDGGSFENANGAAIHADGVETGGDLFMLSDSNNRFEAKGEVRLLGAKIGGQWACDGGSFENANGAAIHADEVETGGGLFMLSDSNNRFEAKGEVRLLGAKIGGQWACVGGSFEKGISAEQLTAESFLCRSDKWRRVPQMNGNIVLTSAEIKSHFQWNSVTGKPKLKLDHARIGVLDIEPAEDRDTLREWSLNGLYYDRLENPKEAANEAMLSLLKQSDGGQFFPQPYRQLFRALRAAGHSEQATKVMIEMKREQFRDWHTKARWFRKPIIRAAAFLSSLVGHGYRPSNAVVIALCLWVVSGTFYWASVHPDWHQIMAPREAEVRFASPYREDGVWPSESPRFFPYAYALDRMVPIVEFGQVAEFQPKGRTYVQSLGIDVGMWLQIVDWFLLISGWILTTLLVSSLTGLMRRVEADD